MAAFVWAAAERDHQQRSTHETNHHSHKAEPRPESPDERFDRELKERVAFICDAIQNEIQTQCKQFGEQITFETKKYVYNEDPFGRYVCAQMCSTYSDIWVKINPHEENASISIYRIIGPLSGLSKLIRSPGNQFTAPYNGTLAAGVLDYMKPISKMITVVHILTQKYFLDVTFVIGNLVSFKCNIIKHNDWWFMETVLFAIKIVPDGFISVQIAGGAPVTISNTTGLISYIKNTAGIKPRFEEIMTHFDQELDKLILLQDPVQLHALLKEFECKLDQLIIWFKWQQLAL